MLELSLFSPNSHSKPEITWKPVIGELRGFIVALLLKEYGISSIENVEQVNAWEVRSNNFRITRVEGGHAKQLLLRKHIQHATLAAIAAVDEVLSHLSNGGIKVAKALPTKNGGQVVESEGAFWQLYPFIPGDYFEGTKDQLTEAATQISKLHQALSVLVPSDNLKVLLNTRPDVPLTAMQLKRFLDKATDDGECSSLFKQYFDFLSVQAEEVESLHSKTVSPKQVIHADLHPHNLLFESDTLTAILDFGDIRSHYRAFDAAGGAHRLIRQFVIAEGKPWQESLREGSTLFWDAYQFVFPLSKEDESTIPVFMKMAILRKTQGTLTNYYGGKAGWTDTLAYSELLKQLTLLHEAVAIEKTI